MRTESEIRPSQRKPGQKIDFSTKERPGQLKGNPVILGSDGVALIQLSTIREDPVYVEKNRVIIRPEVM